MSRLKLALVGAGFMGQFHAQAIADSDVATLAQQIVERGLSVRDAEALARKGGSAARRPGGVSPGKDADTRALEEDLESVLGLKVSVQDKGGAGEIRIAYATLEQLDDLCRRLTRG